MEKRFNPRDYGIEPYHTIARGAFPSFSGQSHVTRRYSGNTSLFRITLRGKDTERTVELLGDRCDIGIGGNCIYLYPGDSHSISRNGMCNEDYRSISASGLATWFDDVVGGGRSKCPVDVTVFKDAAVRLELIVDEAV